MTTTKSSSEKTRFVSIYKASLKALFPFAIVALIIFALMIPLIYIVSFDNTLGGNTTAEMISRYLWERGNFRYGVYMADDQSAVVMFVLVLFAIVIALVQNAYMHSKKMTDLYHSLPVKRPHLLGANMLASMTALFVPFLLVYIVTVLIQIIPYGAYFKDISQYFAYIGMDLLCALVAVAVVYVFTVFIAVNVGTVFDSFALTLVLGLTPMILYCICLAIWSSVTYSAAPEYSHVLQLSPFTFIFQRHVYTGSIMRSTFDVSQFGEFGIAYGKIFAMLALWIVIGAVIFLAAVLCYNRRRSEIAEQTQTEGVFQTIAKCVGAFCGGALFLGIFFNSARGVVLWSIAILAGALLIGIIAELILSRGVRAIKKNIKWLLGAGLLCCLVLIGSRFDLIGYVARVPDAADVESVTISTRGRFDRLSEPDYTYSGYRDNYRWNYGSVLTDVDCIRVITEAHRLAVENQPPHESEITEYSELEQTHPYDWIELTYQMKNGREISRRFNRLFMEAQLKLTELESKAEFIEQNHMLFYVGEEDTYLQNITLYNAIGAGASSHSLSAEDGERLIAAARADMLSESYEEITHPSAAAVGYLDINYRYQHEYAGSTHGSCTVIINEGYQNTLSVLSDLGLLEAMREIEEVDMVVFSPANEFNTVNKISALRPTDYFWAAGYSKDAYNAEYYAKSTDKGLIRSVLAAGRNQMLCRYDSEIGSDVVVAAYYRGDEYIGAQLVPRSVLPDDIIATLSDWYQEHQYGYYGYGSMDYGVEYTAGLPEAREEALPEMELDEEAEAMDGAEVA